MTKIPNHLRAQRIRNDEFYTTKEHVEIIFNKYLHNYDFTNKIVYCPCDGEQSEFVIYLKAHKSDLKYKELIYTSDDFNTHEDIFEKSDVIITNPPFSKLIRQFLPLLKKYNNDFFIFGSQIACSGYLGIVYSENYKPSNIKIILPIEEKEFHFKTPNNDLKAVNIVYVTNIESVPTYKPLFKIDPNNKPSEIIELTTGYRNYDRFKQIAFQKEPMLVPCTVVLSNIIYMFDIIKCLDFHFQNFNDGKNNRYIRLIVKIKDEYLPEHLK